VEDEAKQLSPQKQAENRDSLAACFDQVSCLVYYSTQKIKAKYSS
jgi:hypothetical protein